MWNLKLFCFVRWVWVEAGAQPDLEQKLDIGGFGYPAMAVLNSKKLKFSLLRGPFSEDGIYEFLRWVMFQRTLSLWDIKWERSMT